MQQLALNYQNNLENDQQADGDENQADQAMKYEFDNDEEMNGDLTNLDMDENDFTEIQDANVCHYQGCTYRYSSRTTLT